MIHRTPAVMPIGSAGSFVRSFTALLTLTGLLASATSTRAVQGKWSDSHSLGFTEVHMMLVPGDGAPYHSRVLAWNDDEPAQGAELGWRTGNDVCGTWPDSFLVLLDSWNPVANIFCAGHVQLRTGEALAVGGHGSEHEGIRDASTFVAGSGFRPGSWTAQGRMEQARFYPTATSLRDGRVLVSGGERNHQMWFFGGRVDGDEPESGTGDLLHRIGRGAAKTWDPSVTPLEDSNEQPAARKEHTAVLNSSLGALIFFGGRDGNNDLIDDGGFLWLLRREDGGTLDADYTYQWDKLALGSGSPVPAARSEHTAVAIASNAEMVVFGGTQTSGQAFWRLYYDALTQGWRWQTVSASGGGPSARFGHAAVYSSGKMYVFGGSDNSGGTPTDSQLWEFTFSTGLWSVHTVATGTGKRIPKPRRDHTMVLGSGNTLLLYSGYVGASASSDTLWKLNLDGTSEWTPISVSGTSPGSRLNHAAYFDDSLFIFGGDPNESDKHVYSINPFAASPTWHEEEGEAPYHLSGHSVAPDPAPMILHARKPEVYDPGTDAWVTQSNSGWLPVEVSDRGLYPVQFLVPGSSVANGGGRIVRVGPDAVSRYLDVPASGASQDDWTAVSSGNAGFRPLTGVMYEPGKILIAGGSSTGGSVVGTSKTLNALGSSGWENSSSQLLARINHNLVLLPNGKVLAIGGDGTGGAVICPQLWDPANPSVWSASSPCALEEDDIERTYHSTAILLPDGRVLTGGGQDEDYSSYLRVFCPPYLFKSDGVTLATRPQITEAPNIIAWGDTFTICTPYPSQISKVCLIRPAATTHSFDQNQRYVPLIFDKTSRSGQLIVTAPASPDSAPPGNYLLFIVGSSDGTDVPAVARWVNLGCPTCESVDPDPPDNFAVDIVSDAEAYLLWTASGDDGTVGTAAKDQLRYATSQITSSNWSSAALWRAKVPQCPESGEQDVVGNLTACTNYWFALKTRDGAGHWSGLSDVLYVQTMCGGGPGGGTRAREGDPSLQASRSANETLSILQGRDFGKTVATSGAVAQQATSLPATGGGGGAIAAELQPDGGALRWSVYYLPENEATALAGKDATELLIQEPDGTGGWQTLWRTAPSPASTRFGIRSAGNARRFVFLGSFGLEQAAARVAVDGHKIELEAADHSQLGDLTNSIKMDGDYRGGLAPGDTLGLSYRPAAESAGSPAGTFLVISRLGGSATSSSRQSPDRPQVPSMPASFALGQNQPNPFSRSTRIQFDLPVSSPVRLEVFDLLGRRVATLVDGDYPAGTHSVEWNLLDNRGETLRPGVYVCRMAAGQFRARRKLSLVP